MRRAWNDALSQARARRRRRWGVLFFWRLRLWTWPSRSQCRGATVGNQPGCSRMSDVLRSAAKKKEWDKFKVRRPLEVV
jgi:hypothetical protein